MPSGEIRLVNAKCRATIGVVGNGDQANRSLGKAGPQPLARPPPASSAASP